MTSFVNILWVVSTSLASNGKSNRIVQRYEIGSFDDDSDVVVIVRRAYKAGGMQQSGGHSSVLRRVRLCQVNDL